MRARERERKKGGGGLKWLLVLLLYMQSVAPIEILFALHAEMQSGACCPKCAESNPHNRLAQLFAPSFFAHLLGPLRVEVEEKPPCCREDEDAEEVVLLLGPQQGAPAVGVQHVAPHPPHQVLLAQLEPRPQRAAEALATTSAAATAAAATAATAAAPAPTACADGGAQTGPELSEGAGVRSYDGAAACCTARARASAATDGSARQRRLKGTVPRRRARC